MGVFSDLKPKNTTPRNGFDLSRRSVFSAKVAKIQPVFVQYTVPNSDYRINVNQLLRTQPLQTAAFTGFSINYDFCFVPFNQLYSSFNQFIGQRGDAYLAQQPLYTHIPTFDLFRIVNENLKSIVYDFIVSRFTDSYDEAVVASGVKSQPYRTLVSNKSYHSSVWIDFVRSLDLFGYCNLLPYFKTFTDKFISRWHTDSWMEFLETFDGVESSVFDAIDEVFASQSSLTTLFSDFKIGTKFNIFAAMAYQKIFYEFYRNKYYDNSFDLSIFEFDSDNGSIPVDGRTFGYNKLFNFDDFNSDNVDSFRVVSIFALHQHAYRKDLFTGVLPSMQFGNVSMQIANLQENGTQMRYVLEAKLHNQTSTVDGVRINNDGTLVAPNLLGHDNQPMVDFHFAPEIAISVLESRRADAMQRFKERMMRAGDSTKDIFQAHGWEKPRSEQFHEPIFLGSFDGRLDINTVAATAGTDETQLGQLGANGVAVVSGSEIKFHSSDFGVILGLLYIVKDSEYNSFGCDRQYCLTEPFDFPYPELQNISLSPVVYRQLNSVDYDFGSNKPTTGIVPKSPNDILGYLPAFMEYKTAIDKIHGEFCSGEWNVESNIRPPLSKLGTPIVFSGVFSDWCTPRKSILIPDTLAFMYQQIDVVDSIFLQKQNENQDTDPFLINAYFSCLAVEPISVIGLPI